MHFTKDLYFSFFSQDDEDALDSGLAGRVVCGALRGGCWGVVEALLTHLQAAGGRLARDQTQAVLDKAAAGRRWTVLETLLALGLDRAQRAQLCRAALAAGRWGLAQNTGLVDHVGVEL